MINQRSHSRVIVELLKVPSVPSAFLPYLFMLALLLIQVTVETQALLWPSSPGAEERNSCRGQKGVVGLRHGEG